MLKIKKTTTIKTQSTDKQQLTPLKKNNFSGRVTSPYIGSCTKPTL